MRRTSLPFACALGITVAAIGCSSTPDNPDGDGGGGAGVDTGGATPTGSGAGEQGGQGQGGGSGGNGSGGAPSFEGFSRVDGGAAGGIAGSADIGIAPDGTLYVTWVDGSDDVWIAKSTDGGASFGAPIRVDDATIVPLVSMARHPYVAASNDRVAVVFNDEAGAVYLYVVDAGSLAFASPEVIGTDIVTTFRDFPKAMFLADGTVAVAWHGYPDSGARIFLSRESNGYAAEPASGGAPGLPCECCPLDIGQADDGDVLVAFRNNDNNTREMWAARAPGAGAFSSWNPISSSEGFVGNCPMQGPRLGQLSDGTLFATWSARGADVAGKVYVATSSDGVTWSGGSSVNGLSGDEPTIAVGAPGHLFLTAVTGNGRSSILSSTDGGATWSEPQTLTAPDGDLAVPQAEGNGGVAALAAVTATGSVWLRRME